MLRHSKTFTKYNIHLFCASFVQNIHNMYLGHIFHDNYVQSLFFLNSNIYSLLTISLLMSKNISLNIYIVI